MSEMVNKFTEKDDLALLADLERRFGEAMAQEIMAEVKKADNMSKGLIKEIPGYCGIKALSEGAELYRREAQEALERLKAWKYRHAEDKPGIVEWDGAFLQRQFQRKHQFYMRFHKSYFILYRQAMDAYRVSGITTNPYKEVRINPTEQTTMSKAA